MAPPCRLVLVSGQQWELQGGCLNPEPCSHPSLGAPGEEGAWLPPAVLTLTPDSSRELGRVNVLLHVTLWAGMGLLGRGCFLIGFRLAAVLC